MKILKGILFFFYWKPNLFTGSFQHGRNVILIFCILYAWKQSHLILSWMPFLHAYIMILKSVFPKLPGYKMTPNMSYSISEDDPSLWLRRYKIILPTCIWIALCTGAQPVVIMFLTKHVIVWLLPSCNDTVFSLLFKFLLPFLFLVHTDMLSCSYFTC